MPPFDVNPDKPIPELLADIKHGAEEGAKSTSRTSTFAITPFATLLVRLAQDADKTANKVVRLTWALIGLTIALLILTAFLAWEDADKDAKHSRLQNERKTEQAQSDVIHNASPKL